jgi:hypothetical protein
LTLLACCICCICGDCGQALESLANLAATLLADGDDIVLSTAAIAKKKRVT